jgi:hypothetical protein
MSDGKPSNASLSDDLLRGVRAIAKFIGEDERKTYYKCERRLIPVGKEGSVFIASKARLRAHYDALTAGPAAA